VQSFKQRPELAEILEALDILFTNRLSLIRRLDWHPFNMRDQKPSRKST
jgi:hypothetical protein